MKKLILLTIAGLILINSLTFGTVTTNPLYNNPPIVAGDEIYPPPARGI